MHFWRNTLATRTAQPRLSRSIFYMKKVTFTGSPLRSHSLWECRLVMLGRRKFNFGSFKEELTFFQEDFSGNFHDDYSSKSGVDGRQDFLVGHFLKLPLPDIEFSGACHLQYESAEAVEILCQRKVHDMHILHCWRVDKHASAGDFHDETPLVQE